MLLERFGLHQCSVCSASAIEMTKKQEDLSEAEEPEETSETERRGAYGPSVLPTGRVAASLAARIEVCIRCVRVGQNHIS